MACELNRNTVRVSGTVEKIASTYNISETLGSERQIFGVSEILFSSADTVISEKSSKAGLYTVAGYVVVNIAYAMGEDVIKNVVEKIPFEHIGECENEDSEIMCSARIKSFDVSEVRKSKIEVSIELAFDGFIFSGVDVCTSYDIVGVDQLCILKEKKEGVKLRTSSYGKNMEINFDTKENNTAQVIFSHGRLEDISTVSSNAGIMFNAVLKQEVLYSVQSEDGGLSVKCVSREVGINQFLESGAKNDYDDYVLNPYINSTQSYFVYTNEGQSIVTDVKLSFELVSYKKIEIDVAKDMFSPSYELKLKNKTDSIIIDPKKQSTQASYMHKKNVRTREGVAKVVLSQEYVSYDCVPTKEAIKVNGKVHCEALILCEPNQSVERFKVVFPFEHCTQSDVSPENMLLNVSVLNCTYLIFNDEVTIDAKLQFDVFSIKPSLITSTHEVETQEYESTDNSFVTLKMHYLQPEETLFDLAKQNRIMPEQILLANGYEKEEDLSVGDVVVIRDC